ncbi:MAG: patatin-like phospholipase family protein [Candidatus Omnitrophica bacterium]|nr:patatin-like phospholipase family protein [Candidatus Omnitrophota bacterium]
MKKQIICTFLVILSFFISHTSYAKDRPTIALVLGGGGARGMAHIGVLKMLEEYRIPIDYIVGTSMGAIVGASYATGMSPSELEQIMISTDWKNMFNDTPSMENLDFRQKTEERFYLNLEMGVKNGDLVMPTGFIAGQKLDFLLRSLAPEEEVGSFDDFAIPFKCIATNVGTGEAVILDNGNLVESIRASMAVAGIFTPVTIDNEVLVDGGYTKNLPIDVARGAFHPDIIIAVDVGVPLMPSKDLKTFIDYSSQVTNILFLHTTKEQIKTLDPKDILIKPDLGNIAVSAFDKAETIIADGEEIAVKIREELKQYSVSTEEYKEFLLKQRRGMQKELIVDFIDIAPTKTVSEKQIRARIRSKTGKPLDLKTLKNDLTRIYTLGSFEVVDYNITTNNGKTGILIIPIEKPWGPNYFKFGIQAQDQLKDDNTFNVYAMYKRLNLNSLGGEFRLQPIIGNNIGFLTDFYQPLDYANTFYINPKAHILKNTADIYDGNDRIARYRTWDFSGGITAGVNFGPSARI